MGSPTKDSDTPQESTVRATDDQNGGAAPPADDTQYAAVPVPLARIEQRPASGDRSFRLAYVIVAVVLVGLFAWIGWTWWQNRGLPITIQFEQPHGLKPGAPITLNDVRVGQVKNITILENQQVRVHALLTAGDRVNRMIAREGAVFWIPRFTADLTQGVQNVGAVFSPELAVRPGTGAPRYSFIGRPHEPPNLWLSEGELPIVLRAPRNRGVAEGSAVFYRGLDIGEIVRTQLSRDSSKFEAWLRIYAPYRNLVRRDSHFVDSSGINLEVGFSGMTVDMDSLQSILAGSVTLFTPTEYGPPAEPGREFELELAAEDEYYQWSPYIPFPGYEAMYETSTAGRVPELAQATLSWKFSRGWGWLAEGEARKQGLVLATAEGVLAPENVLVPSDGSADDDARLSIGGRELEAESLELTWRANGVALAKIPKMPPGWPDELFRHPEEPESCTVYGPGKLEKALDKEYFASDGDVWHVTRKSVFNAGWNGAAVLSTRDGKLIGLLIVTDDDVAVHTLPADAPFFEQN